MGYTDEEILRRLGLGEEIRLTDADGREMFVRIVDIVGRCALVEYRPVDGTAGRT